MTGDFLRLLAAIREQHGDVVDGFRQWSGQSIASVAEKVGHSRSSVHLCLSGQRHYAAVRRSIEVEYSMPAYGMDRILGGVEESGQN